MLPFGAGAREVAGKPCRTDQEESCNQVHATCARTLKFDAKHESLTGMYDKLLDPCKPESDGLKNTQEGWWSQDKPEPTGVVPGVPDPKSIASSKLKDKLKD